MTDASFRNAGYALMTQENPDQDIQSKRKTYTPVAFETKFFPLKIKNSGFSVTQKVFGNQPCTSRFRAHFLRSIKTDDCLNDNKSVTRFVQTKAIHPSLWNECVYALQLNFKVAQTAGTVNIGTDFLSRLELKVTEKIRHEIRGYTNSNHRCDNIFLRCCRRRTILLPTSRW